MCIKRSVSTRCLLYTTSCVSFRPPQQTRMFIFFHFKINNMVNRSFELQVWWPFFYHKMKTKTASTKALGFYFTKGLKLQEVSLQDTESAHLVCFTAHGPT